MHRFFLSPEQCQSHEPVLEGREAHHALHVLRLQTGVSVEILDGQGHQFTCLIRECGRRTLRLEIQDRQDTPRPQVNGILYQGLLKPKAMDWVLQKATELGVARIVPLQTRHSIARVDQGSSKMEKWSWIMVDALKQSGGTWLPVLDPPAPIGSCLGPADLPDLSLAASLQSSRHPQHVFQEFRKKHGQDPRSVGIWVGPEGDFTGEEMELLLAAGIRDITLGSRTLRSETAALYCLSLVHYELGD